MICEKGKTLLSTFVISGENALRVRHVVTSHSLMEKKGNTLMTLMASKTDVHDAQTFISQTLIGVPTDNIGGTVIVMYQ